MSKSLHVKKGDTVKVIAGQDKGTTGEVLRVMPKENKVVVEGVNIVTKHTPANPNAGGRQAGGIVKVEAPIHASNVALVVSGRGKDATTTRVGHQRVDVTKRRADGTEYESTRSVRIARKTGEEI